MCTDGLLYIIEYASCRTAHHVFCESNAADVMAESANELGIGVVDSRQSEGSEDGPLTAEDKTSEEREIAGEEKAADLPAVSMEDGLDRLLHRHRRYTT